MSHKKQDCACPPEEDPCEDESPPPPPPRPKPQQCKKEQAMKEIEEQKQMQPIEVNINLTMPKKKCPGDDGGPQVEKKGAGADKKAEDECKPEPPKCDPPKKK